jgi:hypothetical protein
MNKQTISAAEKSNRYILSRTNRVTKAVADYEKIKATNPDSDILISIAYAKIIELLEGLYEDGYEDGINDKNN